MFLIRFFLLLSVLSFAYSAKGKKRPWRSAEKFQIEILSKNQTSIQARFRPLIRVKKYFVSVSVKNLADVPSHYTVKLTKKRDRNDDGYFYVDTKNVLEPGTRYEFSVSRFRQHRFIQNKDVFTDCNDYSFYCEASYGQTCLLPTQLCDGRDDCVNGTDEVKIGEACANTLPERPTPPPPPANTPCMKNLTATKARAISNGIELSNIRLPTCGDNGHYVSMECDGLACHCVHPLTGEILKTQNNFDPFVHWDFAATCEKKSRKQLAKHRGSSGESTVPEVEPPPNPEIIPPEPEILPPEPEILPPEPEILPPEPEILPPEPEILPPFGGMEHPEPPPFPEGWVPPEFRLQFGNGSVPEIPPTPEQP